MSNRAHPSREDYIQALQSMDTIIDITVDDLIKLAQRAEQYSSQRITGEVSVGRVMRHPVRTVKPQTPLADAAHILATERISGLPVVDEDEILVGIITEADFLRAFGLPAQEPHYNVWQTLESLFKHLNHSAEIEAPEDPVSKHMVNNVITIRPDQNIHQLIDVMKHHRVKRAVVVDEGNHVQGIITRSDLVRLFFDPYTRSKQK